METETERFVRCKRSATGCKKLIFQNGVYCVDLGESFAISIQLLQSALIEPRMSPVKFGRSPFTHHPTVAISGPFGIV